MRNLIFALALLVSANLYSQKMIEVSYINDDQGSYRLFCQNNDYCSYTIVLNFTDLTNLECSSVLNSKLIATPGRAYLVTLKPKDPAKPYSFEYKYEFVKGYINPKLKSDFTYLLPVRDSRKTEVFGIDLFKLKENEIAPKDFYALGFKMEAGDTVYAARSGSVTVVSENANLELSGYSYYSKDNFIEIVHDDHSFGKYEVLSKVLVHPGQWVEAADPIGIAGGEKYQKGTQVRFSVYYNYEQKQDQKKAFDSKFNLQWAYQTPKFFTLESGSIYLKPGESYTSAHPENIITQEMSKRQIKKWKSLHK